jgi:hypothetical protein
LRSLADPCTFTTLTRFETCFRAWKIACYNWKPYLQILDKLFETNRSSNILVLYLSKSESDIGRGPPWAPSLRLECSFESVGMIQVRAASCMEYFTVGVAVAGPCPSEKSDPKGFVCICSFLIGSQILNPVRSAIMVIRNHDTNGPSFARTKSITNQTQGANIAPRTIQSKREAQMHYRYLARKPVKNRISLAVYPLRINRIAV